MKRKGFTLVELLVVIAIIALLMGILMPALAMVKRLAARVMCGTNLSGIGKAMTLYAGDYEDDYPVAGGRNATLTTAQGITNWDALPTSGSTLTAEQQAFGATDSKAGQATMTSNFFLLIKYADCTPKQFVCNGDTQTSAFSLNDDSPDNNVEELADVWDFGSGGTGANKTQPGKHCSYSYHMPFTLSGKGRFPLTSASKAKSPLAADKSPWLDDNAKEYINSTDKTKWPPPTCTNGNFQDPKKKFNAAPHDREGQNVLYVDTHVSFEKYSNCGIENDNIWFAWGGTDIDDDDKQIGKRHAKFANNKSYAPATIEDAYLMNTYPKTQ